MAATRLKKPIRRAIGKLLVELSHEGLKVKRMRSRKGWSAFTFDQLGKMAGKSFKRLSKQRESKMPVTKMRAAEAARRIRDALKDCQLPLDTWLYDGFESDLDALSEAVLGGKIDEAQFLEAWREFYTPYPNKKAPEAGKRALRKLIKEHGFDIMPRINRGLVASIAEWKRNGTEKDFMPYPASWLNAGQFDNETSQPKKRKADVEQLL